MNGIPNRELLPALANSHPNQAAVVYASTTATAKIIYIALNIIDYSSESSESSESSDPPLVEPENILSFQRLDSNDHFLISPKNGTSNNTTNAQQKFTPRLTPCSTFTETGIGCCQFCHVPSTFSVYLPAGSDDNVASWSWPPSDHDSPSSTPL